ncbi:MAG TPA: YetF domain-containing protein [Chitinophagaceae bacterium]|nr:YetF domain-containing protein [Chitinophagaceae bacterium]
MGNFTDYLIIAGKSVTIYVFIIAAIRIFGKKELTQLSVIDLVFILLISNSVQNAMVGNDTTVQGGMAAALGLFITNYIFKIFLRKSDKFSKIVQGEKIVIVVGGKIQQYGLKKSMMSVEEVEMAVREHGVKDITEADLVVLEVDGNVTVLSHDYSHKTVKKRKKPQLSHNP